MANAKDPKRSARPLLTERAALILLLSGVCALALGLLSRYAGCSPAQATLAGVSSVTAGIRFFDWLIG